MQAVTNQDIEQGKKDNTNKKILGQKILQQRKHDAVVSVRQTNKTNMATPPGCSTSSTTSKNDQQGSKDSVHSNIEASVILAHKMLSKAEEEK